MTTELQGAPRTYDVRTYGCQMNVHDSERISGLMEDAGYVRAADADSADVVVFNTCAVRENADNRLYGNLGHLKPVKDRTPGMQIAVGGCLAQKDQAVITRRAPWVDVVLGTHNVHRAAELVDGARTAGPVTEIFDAAVLDDEAMFPSALPARRETTYNAWVTIQVGCDRRVEARTRLAIIRPFQSARTLSSSPGRTRVSRRRSSFSRSGAMRVSISGGSSPVMSRLGMLVASQLPCWEMS